MDTMNIPITVKGDVDTRAVEQLTRKAQQAFDRSQKRTEALRAKRNDAVREALAEGWTHAAIAEATGLTRGRINQLREGHQ